MKIIVYAGTELMTGDAIASALMEYCAALAQESAAETVEIPVVDSQGVVRSAIVLVGPASQIVAQHIDTEFEDVVDADVIRLLEQRTRAHRPVAQARPAEIGPASYTEQWAAEL